MKKGLRVLLVLVALLVVGLTIFWFARPADTNFDAARTQVPNARFSRFAEVDGVRVHYQERGEGVPLVLLHGNGSSTYTWADVFPLLSNQFHVVAVDLKGFGFTSKPAGDYTRRAQGELVVHLLDQLKLDKVVLCGSSMGGEVAMNVAVYHPERVRALLLVDSLGARVAGSVATAPGFVRWPVVGPLAAALALTSDGLVRSGLRPLFYDQAKVTDERVAAYHRPLKTRDGQRASLDARAQLDLDPIEPRVGEITQPTLIVWGAEDKLIPLAAGQKLNGLIKGSRLVVFEKCGHLPQEEMPQRFVLTASDFLASLDAKPEVAEAKR